MQNFTSWDGYQLIGKQSSNGSALFIFACPRVFREHEIGNGEFPWER